MSASPCMKRLNVKYQNHDINMSLPAGGVLSAIVTVADRSDREPGTDDRVDLYLGGLDATDNKHPRWGNFDLSVGDTITITVHGDRISDTPIKREGPSEAETEQQKRDYVRQMAAEWGWSITEP